MFKLLNLLSVPVLGITILCATASADIVPVGALFWDVTAPGSTGQFDILNGTGPNSTPFPDPTFPVTSTVTFSDLSLTVDFSDGSTAVFASSYFTTSLDGISFNGSAIPIGGANPLPIDATLTGTLSPTTITLNDGSTDTILPTFTATIESSSGIGSKLNDGDFTVINATTTSGTAMPEPDAWILLATVGLSFLMFWYRPAGGKFRKFLAAIRVGSVPLVLLAGFLVFGAQAFGVTVNLNVATVPSTGVAGINSVNVTGNGFPAGAITPGNVTLNFATSCGGATVASVPANSVQHVIGTVDRVHFVLPGTLSTATYYVSLNDATDGITSGATCSAVSVTHTSAALSACIPTSSLGLNAPVSGPAAVSAIVPNGAWSSGSTGIQVVQLETGGGPVVAPVSVPTPSATNSCAANPATNEAVCVANNTDVYTLNATTGALLGPTLASGSNAFAGFSGGSCENCGVAINALTNQAVIAMGHTGLSGTGLQTLDLATNTFGPVLSLAAHVSEDISIDPTRGYILSPNEGNVYDIEQFNSTTGAFTGEFAHPVSIGGEFDSAAEDCTTGIALSVSEFSNTLYMADLTQISLVPGAPGSWSAPQSITSLIGAYSAGPSGVTVAPGTSHLAVVTGEFGGSVFAVVQLPSTSGTGTPAVVDYADTCISGFNAGLDPHTVSAYTSPNDGKPFVVFASSPPPTTLAVVDMAAVLGAPRLADGHTLAGGCLVNGGGLVRFISTH